MKRVKIGEFRDRASDLIRRAAGGETVVILNRDREVAKIVPMTAKTDRGGGLVGCLAGTAAIRGDIEAPIASPGAWFRKLSLPAGESLSTKASDRGRCGFERRPRRRSSKCSL